MVLDLTFSSLDISNSNPNSNSFGLYQVLSYELKPINFTDPQVQGLINDLLVINQVMISESSIALHYDLELWIHTHVLSVSESKSL